MSSSLTEDYLRWLAPQIRDEQDGLSHPEREFTGLISLMFDMEFYELVPMDRNRIEDGISLRIEFCNERDISTNSLDYLGPGRFLEVLIALSRRLAFNAGGSNAPDWACFRERKLAERRRSSTSASGEHIRLTEWADSSH
jgi:hypothetical protein